MKKYIILFFLLILSATALADPSDNNFTVSNVDYKVIDQSVPGFIIVSFKVDVKNYGAPGTIYIELQGVDSEGIEILKHNFSDRFNQNEHKTFTGNRTFSLEKWNMVKVWKIGKSQKTTIR